MGYGKIAGMPVVAGLYTLLLPMAAFALGPGRLPARLDIQVAAYQVPDMIGVPSTGRLPTGGLLPAAFVAPPHARPQDLGVPAAVILVVLFAARITRGIPVR
jgi:hypothetical protein